MSNHPNRLLPVDPAVRAVARRLYDGVRTQPIISPHGHTDAAWFATNAAFPNPTELLITPDHYVYRMLYSQGVKLEDLGISPTGEVLDLAPTPEAVWQLFASHYHLFRGTPTRVWFDQVFADVFGLQEELSADTAEAFFTSIADALATPAFRPRALFERFGIEVLATTESPLDPLVHHAALADSNWSGRVITTFRPDPVLDPEFEGFTDNLRELAELTGEDTAHYAGYLDALRNRRAYFRAHGATATDHGHPSAATANLSHAEAEKLYSRVQRGDADPAQAEHFRAHMLTVMADMSIEDGMVMQLHPGSHRNHNQQLFERFGRDRGADIPSRTDYVGGLKPLLDRHGNSASLTLILFTLDESTYSRELAPLAGHYPCLRLGPAWWFHDSPEGMRRFRAETVETAGFYNTVGFNDDTRAFLSIPARHDMARRIDCSVLATMVADHRLHEAEAAELAGLLAGDLARQAYRL